MVKQATAVKASRAEMFGDFYTLIRKCCICGDYDPFHPLLRETEKDMDREEALWFSCLFIAHYNPGSAWVAWHDSKVLQPKRWDLPIETARRALFGGRIHRHLEDLCCKARAAGGLYQYFTQGFGRDAGKNWQCLRANIGAVYGAGRWAEYTFGEILQKVHGFNVRPTDMGNEGSSGPRNGLILLMGKASLAMEQRLYTRTVRNVGQDVPWFDRAVLESLCCDFNSLNKGRYYVGRDIDRQQYRICRAEQAVGYRLPDLWAVRGRVFPSRYLGELGGWQGIDKQRLKVYQETGEVIDR